MKYLQHQSAEPESWNDKENISKAIIKYQDKRCFAPKAMIWKGNLGDGEIFFKYNSDQDFLDEVINSPKPGCGWNLTLDKIM